MQRNFQIIFMVATLAFLASPAFAADAQLEEYIRSYREAQGKLLPEVEKAQNNSAEIIAAITEIRKLQALEKKHKKDEKSAQKYAVARQKIGAEIERKYSLGLSMIVFVDSDFDFEKMTKKGLYDVLAKTLRSYDENLSCFDGGSFSKKETCERFFRENCKSYGYNNGKMHYLKLTDRLEKTEIDVTENDARLEKGTAYFSAADSIYQFCRLRGMTSAPFPSKELTVYPTSFNIIEGYWGEKVYPHYEEFKRVCIDKKPSVELVTKLQQLHNEFSKDWFISDQYDKYTKWVQQCRLAAQPSCTDTYVVKDQVILSYPTKGCEVRDVAKEDVVQDMEIFSTQAEKLNHSTLLDHIETCQQAHNGGYFWVYQKPKLPKKCIDGDKRPKKKKK